MHPARAIAVIALLAAATLTRPAFAGGDPEKGAAVFRQCMICHMIGPGAQPRIGPPLNGVAGAVWGSHAGFAYSPGMQAEHAAGKVWDGAALDKWIENPRAVIPGTKMVFAGVHDAQARADVIAYISQFAADGSKK
ncbi:MAG: c-type cytochrome [Rhodospirillales bacterium]|nr:c-type cytochrome [Rhodospirillales bacterium]MDE2575009.1 c-type cytochrome [Rhodospirillales bacterium]